MKTARRNYVILWTTLLMCIGLALGGTGVGFAARAAQPYYLCLESQDYRILQSNVLRADGDEFVVNRSFAGGERLLIADGKGTFWGGADGAPLKVKDTLTYRVAFRPDAPYDDGGYVSCTRYAPARFSISVGGAETAMTYQSLRLDYEEYYAETTLAAGDRLYIVGDDGTRYGETGTGAAAEPLVVTRAGEYRIVFTADPDHRYGADETYFVCEEVPALYYSADGRPTADESVRMTRNEDTVAYAEYSFDVDIPACDYEFSYAVYDADADRLYYPADGGKITVKDEGGYHVRFAPDHVYGVDGDYSVRTKLEWIELDYGGYYLIGDPNGWRCPESDDADRFRFVRSENKDYEEYLLTYAVSDAELRAYGGELEFYISDGAKKYRQPADVNIKLAEAGTYEILFSPVHDYGRLRNYRKTLTGEEPAAETVRIATVAEFEAAAAKSADAEYTRNKTFELTADLDFGGKATQGFRLLNGAFDGCYHAIRNVKVESDYDDAALFARVGADGVLQRLNVENLIVSAQSAAYVGLVGQNAGRIERVRASGSVRGDRYVGLVGQNTGGGTLSEVENACTVRGIVNVGGVVGFNAGRMETCSNTGAVNPEEVKTSSASSMTAVGGVAGYSTGKILNATNGGAVGYLNQGHYVGGIVGLSSGELYFCKNGAPVAGDTVVGGIVGYYGRIAQRQGSLLETLLAGTPYEEFLDAYFGSGDDYEEAEDQGVHRVGYCVDTGAVSAESQAGGIAGVVDGVAAELKNVAVVAAVSARGGGAGGAVGSFAAGELTDAMTAGTVVSAKSGTVGGIAGQAAGTLRYCVSSAQVRGAGNLIGGLAGRAAAVENSYSAARLVVDGGTHVGMIAGYAGAGEGSLESFRNNYFTGGGYGLDGKNYGYSDGYAAAYLTPEELTSVGELSAKLVGFDPGHWLSACTEAGYPTLRNFEECETEDNYPAFAAWFDAFRPALDAAARETTARRLSVTFYAYDVESDEYDFFCELYVPYGGAVTELPEPPAAEGCFVWWEAADLCRVTQNVAVYELYDRAKTSLADRESDPNVLIEGRFYSDSVLTLVKNGALSRPVVTRGGEEQTIGETIVRYRVAAPSDYTVRVSDADGVRTRDAQISGNYLVFRLGADEWFEIVPDGARVDWQTFAIAAGSVAGALLLALLILGGVALRRKKRVAAKIDGEEREANTVCDRCETRNEESAQSEEEKNNRDSKDIN